MVWHAQQATVPTTELDLRPRLDVPLFYDGGLCLAGLAATHATGKAIGYQLFRCRFCYSVGIECTVVGHLLWIPITGLGILRDLRFVVRDCNHRLYGLPPQQVVGAFTVAISRMVDVCPCLESCTLAIEYTLGSDDKN